MFFYSEKIVQLKIFVISRYFYHTERSSGVGRVSRNVTTSLVLLWITLDDRSLVLCRARHINSEIRRRLRLYLRGIWTFACLLVFMGSKHNFCVS